MSLDKAIEHGKEKRKPYRGSKAIDGTCRNHGTCEWCKRNRTHKFLDKEGDSVRAETTYYADDGTEFDTAEECLAYEKTFKDELNAVSYFDDEFEELTDMDDIESYGVFMYIKDGLKARLLFERLGEYITFDKPEFGVSDGDVLQWSDYGWEDLRAKAETIKKTIETIEGKARQCISA